MKKFGRLTVTNREFERIFKKYLRFYKTHNKCTVECPMGLTEPRISWPQWIQDFRRKYFAYGFRPHVGECFCPMLPMFPPSGCPCGGMGNRAFIALEKMVKKYEKLV